MKTFKAVNWNKAEDNYSNTFYKQNKKQFWDDEVIPVAKDLKDWHSVLTDAEKEVYRKVFGGLTLLDTEQGNVGMTNILLHTEGQQKQAVLGFMVMMENLHAKAYSTVFHTLLKRQEIDEVFEWVETNKYLQTKTSMIDEYYNNITDEYSYYMALVASVFLESFLFYSGFFYPLYLAGQGIMVNSGELISLILRDESIHGVFVGLLAQESYARLTKEEQEKADAEVYYLLDQLMLNEVKYTKDVYGSIDLHFEVVEYLKYNANKALQNLGRKEFYQHQPINAIVQNGISTETKTHDFFSTKGNGYQLGDIVHLEDENFEKINELLTDKNFTIYDEADLETALI